MALRCSCVFSLVVFGGAPCFPLLVRSYFLALRVGRSCNVSVLLGFCLCYPVFHVFMLPNTWLLCVSGGESFHGFLQNVLGFENLTAVLARSSVLWDESRSTFWRIM
jgi:hypothetical protein